MDLLLEGSFGLLCPRARFALRHTGRLPCPAQELEEKCVLCCLHLSIVSFVLRGPILYLNSLIRSAHGCVCVCRSSTDQSSAVCAFNVTDINEVFSRGKFKTEVTVEMSDVKWVTYNGELPVPRPGAVSGH